MNRARFLTLASLVALSVGALATFAPALLLKTKGVMPLPATEVWVREVGVALLAIGVTAAMVRHHPASPTLRAFLFGNALHQVLLAPIEVAAWRAGTIPSLAGIVPNTLVHVSFALAFFALAWRMREPARGAASFVAQNAAPHRTT